VRCRLQGITDPWWRQRRSRPCKDRKDGAPSPLKTARLRAWATRPLRPKAVPLQRSRESSHGSDLGLPNLQPDEMVRPQAGPAGTASIESFNGCRKVCGRGGCGKTEALQVTGVGPGCLKKQFLHGFLSPHLSYSTRVRHFIVEGRCSSHTPEMRGQVDHRY
jgi:hypothetical protein